MGRNEFIVVSVVRIKNRTIRFDNITGDEVAVTGIWKIIPSATTSKEFNIVLIVIIIVRLVIITMRIKIIYWYTSYPIICSFCSFIS